MSNCSDIIITDTSVLVNFLKIDRMDLLQLHPCNFYVTNHVTDEISYAYPEQIDRLTLAKELGIISEMVVDDPVELGVFNEMSEGRRLGNGESSAIAVAVNRGLRLAIDDRRAIKQAKLIHPDLEIKGTADIMAELLMAGAIDLAHADSLKEDWANNHKFMLKINSFQELLPAG